MSRRSYNSPVRAEKAEKTRESLLEAATGLLVEGGVAALSIPKVAERAGVTAPTAYKYFPTLEDLLRAHLEHVRPRLGLSTDELGKVTPANTAEQVARNFRRFERHAPLLRAVMDSPTFRRVREQSRTDRAGLISQEFADGAEALPDRELRAALGAAYMFVSPMAWSWLRGTWGLSGRDAARAAAWASSVLVREILSDPESIDPVDVDNNE